MNDIKTYYTHSDASFSLYHSKKQEDNKTQYWHLFCKMTTLYSEKFTFEEEVVIYIQNVVKREK